MAPLVCIVMFGLVSSGAHAEEEDELPKTFVYKTEAERNYLRAVVEFEAVFALGFLYYVTTADINDDWDVNYQWETFRNKLTLQSLGIDGNHFGTNFIGHPLGGTGYYLSARSNRLSAFESAGFSFAGSMLWEYFGEISERVSLNDTITTPFAGVAIGESTTQLGAFFDRSSGTTSHKILGTAFAPFKSFNDWVDGLELDRVPYGYPRREWHRFDLEAGINATQQWASGFRSGWQPGLQLRFAERLARLPHYDGAGRYERWFDDGNVSSLSLDALIGEDGLVDLSFQANVLLAGHYFRDAKHDASGGLWGEGSVVGLATSFEYALHDYRRGQVGDIEKLATVEPAALYFEYRGVLGDVRIGSRVHGGPSFGGISAHAREGYEGDLAELPDVLRNHQYYLGLGPKLTSTLELSWEYLEAGLGFRAVSYEVVRDPNDESDLGIADSVVQGTARLGYHFPDRSTVLRLSIERWLRQGTMGGAHAQTDELSLFANLGATF